jgi:hypothetical protein
MKTFWAVYATMFEAQKSNLKSDVREERCSKDHLEGEGSEESAVKDTTTKPLLY